MTTFKNAALFFVIAMTFTVSAAQRPNIVYIMVDDMGYGDPTCNNPNSKTPTPNIDRLAHDGMRFTDAHAAGTTCVPSRFGLMTGKYPFRGELKDRKKKKGPLLPEGRLTLPAMMKRAGYTTAMVGKWHLGFENEKEPGDLRLTGGPVDRGFDTYFGMPASLDIPPYYYIRGAKAIDPPTDAAVDSDSMDKGWSRIQGAFWRAGGQAPGFKHENVLHRFQAEAVKRLETHEDAGTGKPLFLYVPLTGPHTPWVPFEEYKGKSGAAMYGDFVMSVDHVIGAILDKLDDLKMTENTLVVFTSDNGPVWYDTDEAKFDHVSTGPLLGMKGDGWEGGHRVPYLVRWPGHVEAKSTTDQLICFTDVMATFAELTGQVLGDDVAEDSYSFLPALLGREAVSEVRTNHLIESSHRVIRSGDWVLLEGLGSGGFSQPRKVKAEPNGPTGQLYNLKHDIGQKNNLWTANPGVVKRLQDEMEKFWDAGRSRGVGR